MAENKIKTDDQLWKQYTKRFGINNSFVNNYFLSITIFLVFCMMVVVSMARLAQGGSPTLSVGGMLFGVLGIGIMLNKYVKKDKPTLP
jgi:hypothetical protein